VTRVQDVLLPDIGDFSQVEIIEILVAPGERVEREQSLLTLESDKATMEIPAPTGGLVKEIKVGVGDKVSEGDLLLTLEAADEATTLAPGEGSASEVRRPMPGREESVVAPTAAESVQMVEERLPDIGDFSDVSVIEVLVAPGDQVSVDQSLITLESDKATMEIPSTHAGEVISVAVAVGDKLNQGDLVMTLSAPAQALEAEGELSKGAAEKTPAAPVPAAKPGPAGPVPGEAERRQVPVMPRPEDMAAIAKGRKPHASPAVRRFARELGVDLVLVEGSGPKGRILKEDVQGYIKQALARGAAEAAATGLPFQLPGPPEIDYSKFGEVELLELPRIKKISGRRLHLSWISVPHVTQFDEVDITALEEFRKSQQEAASKAGPGLKVTLLPILMKAVSKALDRFPLLKASLTGDGERLVLKHFTHLGVAVDTPEGLVVPVIRDVDKKGILELARELMEVSAKARDGKLLPGDMQGGCFTITSLGGIGGTAFTPILNSPEVAILGISRSEMKPVWNGAEFRPRLLLPMSLSYDHRVVDGAEAVRFTSLLRELLGDIRRLLL
jgi:pyruvate dehydrogenase E2 component (dihydrolipoamide acetyltransferase)